jgi:hypothetical protein
MSSQIFLKEWRERVAVAIRDSLLMHKSTSKKGKSQDYESSKNRKISYERTDQFAIELENVSFGTMVYPKTTWKMCKCCARDNILEYALHESTLTPESVAEITILVGSNVSSLKQIRLSLEMKIDVYSLTETPETIVHTQEIELGYELKDKDQLKVACDG